MPSWSPETIVEPLLNCDHVALSHGMSTPLDSHFFTHPVFDLADETPQNVTVRLYRPDLKRGLVEQR